MERPQYAIHIAPNGKDTEVLRDGRPEPRLFRVEVTAAVNAPSMLTMWQYCDLTVDGVFGERVIRHDCPDCQGHPLADS